MDRFFNRILTRRHFWRYATFSEIAELYASRVLRMTALHLVGGFISIYLYKNGFSLMHIALMWAAFYAFKAVMALPLVKLVSIIGPKRSMFVGNILYIPAMIGFAMLPTIGPWVLIPVLTLEALSAAIYNIAHYVDFSKVKSLKHAGKELAFMNIVEKLAAGLSPVIGGFMALWFGPGVVLVISAMLFLVAALPLFRTGERVKLGKPLSIRSLPWHLIRRHAVAHAATGYEYFMGATAWSLFAAVFIIGVGTNDDIYAVFGMLASVILFVSLIISYAYGRLIDGKKGKDLMWFSAVVHSVVHLMRGTISTPVGIAGLNVANEVGAIGFKMPYTRALFDNADRSGNRISYIGIMEVLVNIGATIAALMTAGFIYSIGDEMGLRVMFIVSAIVVLLLLTARFPLYRR